MPNAFVRIKENVINYINMIDSLPMADQIYLKTLLFDIGAEIYTLEEKQADLERRLEKLER